MVFKPDFGETPDKEAEIQKSLEKAQKSGSDESKKFEQGMAGYPKTLWKAFGDSRVVNSKSEEDAAKADGYNKPSEPADPGSGGGGGGGGSGGGSGSGMTYPFSMYDDQGNEHIITNDFEARSAAAKGWKLTKPSAPVQKQKLLFKRDPDGTLQTITVTYPEGDDNVWQTYLTQGWSEQDPGVAQAPFEPSKYNTGGTWYAVSNYPGVSGDAYAIEYTLDSGRKIYYLASKAELDSMFGEGVVPPSVTSITWSDFSDDSERYFGGAASEVIGTDDSFSTIVTRTIQAGGTKELALPEFVKDDKDLLDIFFVAVLEGKSQSWLLKEFSKIQAFKNEFPGIDTLFSQSNDWEQAVNDWNNLNSEINRLNTRYNEKVDSSKLVEAAIKKGYTIEDIAATYDIFERAEQNKGFLTAFQAIIDADPNVNFKLTDAQGIVDFYEGKAPTEVYDLYEAASIQEQGTKFSLGIDADQAIQMALATPGQILPENIAASLQEAAIQIARVREDIDIGKYNLSEQAIINTALGLKTPGISDIEIADAMSSIFQENKALQETDPFTLNKNSAIFQGKRDIRSV